MTKEEFMKMKKELEALVDKIILMKLIMSTIFFIFLVST